jgi:aminoglycoside phosphotransferase (APT) family kinase protein
VAAIRLEADALLARLVPIGASEVAPLTGGASSLTFSARTGGRPVVVKVAPPGLAPVLNRDVLRQARLLRALHGSAVPVPEVLWEDAGDPPDVPPLFVMSFVAGTSLEPLFDGTRDDDATDDATVVAERLRNATRTLAALHTLDPVALGLAGEPVSGPEEEIDRWSRLLATVDPTLAPGWTGVEAALRDAQPPGAPPAVVHGDFRLGNLLASGSEITAVVDWEIWSVGDPRVDLGWFLVNADPETYRRATPYSGLLPEPPELLAVYEDAVGHPVPDVGWFRALACFKSVATWALIVKHNRRRDAPDPDVETLAGELPHLLDLARRCAMPGATGQPTDRTVS